MYTLVLVIFSHLIGDSALLSTELRQKKIESVWYMLKHVGIYTLVFLVSCPLFLHLTIVQGIVYSLIIGVLHFIVDYILTKIKLKYWSNGVYAGVLVFSIFEHVLQISILLVTFYYLYPEVAQFDEYINMVKDLFIK
jgi:hypothetical protein